MSDKTEEPTPKRLRKAQEEGDSPISAFATSALGFVFAVAIAPAAVLALAARSAVDLRTAIAKAGDESPSLAAIGFDLAAVGTSVLVLVAPILVAAAIAAAVASVVQSGGAIATKKLQPKLDRLNVFEGLKNLVAPTRLVAVARAALFGGGVVYLAFSSLRAHAADLARSVGRLDAAATVAGIVALDVAKRAALLGLALALLDVIVTRRSWKKKLMMTKTEVKREHKESEGDPQQKAARERAHHELLASATVANVRKASVVVVNPVHLACALKYEDDEDEAPVLVASGHGELATRIVDAARAYGIPVLQDIPLARALIELEIGAAIPEALYEAVAEILRTAWDEKEKA